MFVKEAILGGKTKGSNKPYFSTFSFINSLFQQLQFISFPIFIEILTCHGRNDNLQPRVQQDVFFAPRA
jgi:hypothetical protein